MAVDPPLACAGGQALQRYPSATTTYEFGS